MASSSCHWLFLDAADVLFKVSLDLLMFFVLQLSRALLQRAEAVPCDGRVGSQQCACWRKVDLAFLFAFCLQHAKDRVYGKSLKGDEQAQ